MTFKEYIDRRPPKYDVQGDFVRMVKARGDLPDVATWRELKVHMEKSGTPPHVVEAGEIVWSKYIAALRDAGRP